MLCPVRCFTCGRVLADKIRFFQRKRQELLEAQGFSSASTSASSLPALDASSTYDDRVLGVLMDDLGLNLMCCRRHLLSDVDMFEYL